MRILDLRSDTLTRPDAEMRRAMAEAEVGDDVYGEDPTVRRLEEAAAAAVGQEAALFVPSGIQGNQIALFLLAPPGTEVVASAGSHVLDWEMAAMAAISGKMARPVATDDGLPSPAAMEEAITGPSPYRAATGLLVVENTVNMAGGRVVSPALTDALVALARRHGLPIHLDGARLFNAAVAAAVPAARLAAGFDSVMFCLSKGLGAPAGSLLCGGAGFIREARRVRRMLGGGMRQAGVLAAPGLLALEQGPGRLADDHAHAALLARGLAEIPGLEVDPARVETNIVVARVTSAFFGGVTPSEGTAVAFLERARRVGVLGFAADRERVRFTTYRGVGRREVEEAVARLRGLAP